MSDHLPEQLKSIKQEALSLSIEMPETGNENVCPGRGLLPCSSPAGAEIHVDPASEIINQP